MSNHDDNKSNNRSTTTCEENLGNENIVAVTLYDDQSNAFPGAVLQCEQGVSANINVATPILTNTVLADQVIDQQGDENIPTLRPFNSEAESED